VLNDEGLALNNYLLYNDPPEALAKSMRSRGVPDGLVMSADFVYPRVLAALRLVGCEPGCDVECVGYGRTPWAMAYNIPSIDPCEEELTRRTLEAVKTGRNMHCLITPKLWFPEKQYGMLNT
jgi:DNA-binding LacI/PurR family transcriptional regulator